MIAPPDATEATTEVTTKRIKKQSISLNILYNQIKKRTFAQSIRPEKCKK